MNSTATQLTSDRPALLHVGAVADHRGVVARPGAILLRDSGIVAVASPQEVGEVPAATRLHRPHTLVIPALVNAHAHLDLSHIGPVGFDGDFTRWVDVVRARRGRSAREIAAHVRHGVQLARAGGTAAVGDIAGARSTVPTLVQRELGLLGVSFLEVFGMGADGQRAAVAIMEGAAGRVPRLARGVMHGLQPHAPYSCGPDVYRAAAAMSRPLATHLAETREELQFVASATGPLADMLRRLGVWDDSIAGAGVHAVDHVLAAIGDRPLLAAHLNYIDDAQLQLLAQTRTSVAYCPRASAYFGHAGHRYRELLQAGINVALGTDSIVCLDTPDRLSTLDEMRLLHRRDATDATLLLRMATLNGATALGLRHELFTLGAGASAGLLGLRFDPTDAANALAQVLQTDEAPHWILGPIAGKDDWFVDEVSAGAPHG